MREPDEIDRRWLEQGIATPRLGVLANRSTRGRLAVREHLAACDRIRAIDQEMTALAAERRRLTERVHALDQLHDGTSRAPDPGGAKRHARTAPPSPNASVTAAWRVVHLMEVE